MDAARSRQPEDLSYQMALVEDEVSEPSSHSLHRVSRPATPSESRLSRFSFESLDPHEREPLRLAALGPLDESHEAESESAKVGNKSSLDSNGQSSDGIERSEWWWKCARTADQWWLYELLGAVFSLACFAALVAVLQRSDGKEQTRWLYNRLALNGLIRPAFYIHKDINDAWRWSFSEPDEVEPFLLSWLASIKRPKARGPEHLRQSITRTTWKLEADLRSDQTREAPLTARRHLGLIGAFITIFTLAFDAFAQEVIILKFENKSGVNGTNVGLVARSEYYNGWTHNHTDLGKTTLKAIFLAKLPVRGPLLRNPAFTQFAPYLMLTDAFIEFVHDLNTLAAENNGIFNYQNITAPTAQCSTGNCSWPVVPSLAVCGSCIDVTATMTHTCVGVPGQGDGGDVIDMTNCTYTLPEGQLRIYDAPPGYKFWTTPSGLSVGGKPVLAYVVVGGYVTQYHNNTNYAYLDRWLMINTSTNAVNANVCGLWLCVQTYETNVSDGILSQRITGNWSETDGPINFTSISSSLENAAAYSVNANVLRAFDQNPIFPNANITYGLIIPPYHTYSSAAVRSLANIVDHDAWIDLFALGMSNNVRSTGTSSTPPSAYAGTASTSVPYVHVRWPWLAFPAAMVAASILFLVACIWQTSYLGADPWKSDALALLLASVDEQVKGDTASRWKVERQKVWLDPVESTVIFRASAAGKI
ncbi:hypothetical protein LTS10_004731 [Elasticomyces elasticus]|nr:hypothetical protein LTS10_004731 [Elasticomyces elasticus]